MLSNIIVKGMLIINLKKYPLQLLILIAEITMYTKLTYPYIVDL